MPPHGPNAVPNPKPEMNVSPADKHFDVRPDKQREQCPHEIAQGTITLSPTLKRVTPSPQATISAMHSCPIAKGALKGLLPKRCLVTGSTIWSANPACNIGEIS